MRLARSNVRLLVLIAFYFLFIVIGASIFSTIEAPHENSVIRKLRAKRAAFLEEHPCVKDEALESFIVEIVRAHENRVSPVKNVTSDPNWSFGHSFFFSSTIITTIGYGNITPLSTGGKIFCIVYGLIGIPLTLILLSAFVERLLIPVTYILQFLNSRLGHLYQAFNIRVLHLFIVGLLVVVFFFLVPAAIFSSLEPEWDYVDSLYYCFISLTTIGLGDFTPGDSYEQPYRPLYKVAVVAERGRLLSAQERRDDQRPRESAAAPRPRTQVHAADRRGSATTGAPHQGSAATIVLFTRGPAVTGHVFVGMTGSS
ncbi:hypothetical protein MTO96_027001 [Rhipicephalus appendiculatus]